MNSLALTPAQALVHALGWALLHFLWQGTLVALLLACVLSLLPQRAPQPRYLASCCALFLVMALPLATFTYILNTPLTGASTFFAFLPLDPATAPTAAPRVEPLFDHILRTLDHAMPTVLGLWSIGAVLLLIRLSLGLLVARRMQTTAIQPPPPQLLHTFQHIARRIGVSRPVQLLQSALVQVPTVIGWLRPVVLVPLASLGGLSPNQIEAIFAHELAHIRRHDYLISVLQSIVEALLFYHPATWWISRQIRREREHCCDDLAVQLTGDPLTYARALSLLEESRTALPTIALAANGGTLTMRIQRLLIARPNPASAQPAALTLLTVLLAIGIGSLAHAQAKPAPMQTSIAAPVAVQSDPQLNPAPLTPATLPTLADPRENEHPAIAPNRMVISPAGSNGFSISPQTPRVATPAETPSAQPIVPRKIGNGVSAPIVLSTVVPQYTKAARKAKISGNVLLNLWVDEQGNPTHLRVLRSLDKGLDEQAILAVKQYKFKPALENGKPVTVDLNIEVNFRIF